MVRRIPWPWIVMGVAALAALLYVPQQFGRTETELVSKALYFAVAAMGLNLLTGYNGQVSIGHGAFYGIGAYTTAILMEDHSWSFFATLPAAALLAFVVGAAIGFPALRVKGLYLALITLGMAALFPDLVNRFVDGTGGTSLVQPPGVESPAWAEGFAPDADQWRYYLTLVFAAAMLLVSWNLVRGRFGRALVAVRDHEAAAATAGINPARVKVAAFATSGLYAGVAGSLSVLVTQQADTSKLETFQQSIQFLIAVVIGGAATVLGPVLGAFVFVLLDYRAEDLIADKPILSPAIFGIALILLMFVLPDGIVGGARRLGAAVRRRLRGPTVQPSTT
jgi:branched-chain amino acid transport system permease protein